tara:strand:+ start:187 stop:546 length:360 start_codon:yes stop_codon:yes gene_type:complete
MNKEKNICQIKNKSINPDTLFRVLDLIEGNSKITQRELAKKTGVSLGSVNYCLKGLLIKGYIKINNFSKDPNKLHYLYILTPMGITQKATLTKEFLGRKLEEYYLLKKEIERISESFKG